MQLNFPTYNFKIKKEDNQSFIWDIIRKKWIVLQPEEWVRQHLIHFLINDLKYPQGLMSVEKSIKINRLEKRYDIAVCNKNLKFVLLVECKSPNEKITQATFNQIATYNISLQVPFLLVTNGIHHFFVQLDLKNNSFNFLPEILNWESLINQIPYE